MSKISQKKFLDQNLWPYLIVAALTALVAFSFAVLKIANRNSSELTSPDYYAKGYNLKEIVATERATQATGWHVEVVPLSVEASGDLIIQINILDRHDQPCDSVAGVSAFYRPSDAALDIPAEELTFIGRGRYIRSIPRIMEKGLWNAVLDLKKGSDSYRNRISFMVP
ncbi:FixH family protein [bacterium]|nr:FixH family protein [bacterium]